MALAADAAPVGPPWLAAVLATVAAVGTLLTAVMPAAVEKIKQRTAPPKTEATAAKPASQTDRALDMIDESLRDLRRQRDEAEQEVLRLLDLLSARETELRKRGWPG